MACNCATDEQIKELYRRYGERRKPGKNATFKAKLKHAVYTAGVFICMIPITVLFLFPYVLYKALYTDDKKISIRKFFRLNKNQNIDVREQQVV